MTNHLYGFGATSKLQGINWLEAKAAVAGMKSCCGGVRPHLVSVTSKAENDVVVSLIDDAKRWSAHIGLVGEANPFLVPEVRYDEVCLRLGLSGPLRVRTTARKTGALKQTNARVTQLQSRTSTWLSSLRGPA
jgi:hypothetical protein